MKMTFKQLTQKFVFLMRSGLHYYLNFFKRILLGSKFKLKGTFKCILRDLEGNIIKEQTVSNLVVTVGKEVFARLLAGDTTYSGEINYLAVGTGLSSPNISDTTLETEIDRVGPQAPTPTRSSTEVTYEFFFSASEAIGTLKEVGAFIDGTATVDTGQLFDRAQIDIEKTSLNSLTIQLVVEVV